MVKALFCIVIAGIACASALAQPPLGEGAKIEALVPGVNTAFVPSLSTGETWWVLFQSAGEQVRLRYAPLRVETRLLPDMSYAYDVHAEGFEDNEVILLFRGTKDLPRGPVSTVFSGGLPLVPGLSLKLGPEGAGRRTLETVASKEPVVVVVSEGNPPLKALNISLRAEDGTSQLLSSALLGKDGAVPILRWAGDLDKDHQLDLFIDNPVSVYPTRIALLLSSYAEDGEFVHQVTGFHKK
jgi:hypothetical protein